jgi:hypothetical protein
MSAIPFTQFMMPNGRQVPVTIDRPREIADRAAFLISQGCRFEIEMLRTGEISMAVEHGDDTWAIEIVPNGPEVLPAVDRIVVDAYMVLQREASRPPYSKRKRRCE